MKKLEQNSHKKRIKCVVWDLDNTLWDGILLEDSEVYLKACSKKIIEELDYRGILQSVISKNDYVTAVKKMKEFGIDEYFLYPQINWEAKSKGIKNIADSINISLDSIMFIDDQFFERDEVNFSFPEVMCVDSSRIADLLDFPELNPEFITDDSKIRRQLYINDIKRAEIEESFEGSKEGFLASLDMVLTIRPVEKDDLKRVEELTVRTHQLNSTGYTYSYEELEKFRELKEYKLYIAELNDKYGTYGKIGVVVLYCEKDTWTIKLLLMSCRVVSRGIGTIMINFIKNMARKKGVNLKADFVKTDLNRMMYLTYRFTGFNELSSKDNFEELLADLNVIQSYPDYMKVVIYG